MAVLDSFVVSLPPSLLVTIFVQSDYLSAFAVYNLQRAVKYVAQLIRIFSKLRTGYELGLKRLSHEDSTHTAVDLNSPEVASDPVCSFSPDHRGCFICGLRSINTKTAGILVKKKPKNVSYCF